MLEEIIVNRAFETFLARQPATAGRNNRVRQTNLDALNLILDEPNTETHCWPNSEERIHLRFNDLIESAQARFTRNLAYGSSLRTVARLNPSVIITRLRAANPIIAANWGMSFKRGSFERWREKRLSSLVYHLGQTYRDNPTLHHSIKSLIDY